MEEVEIEREEYSEWTASEDNTENDTKSRKSNATLRMHSEWNKSNKH